MHDDVVLIKITNTLSEEDSIEMGLCRKRFGINRKDLQQNEPVLELGHSCVNDISFTRYQFFCESWHFAHLLVRLYVCVGSVWILRRWIGRRQHFKLHTSFSFDRIAYSRLVNEPFL